MIEKKTWVVWDTQTRCSQVSKAAAGPAKHQQCWPAINHSIDPSWRVWTVHRTFWFAFSASRSEGMPWGLLLHTPPQTTLEKTHTAVKPFQILMSNGNLTDVIPALNFMHQWWRRDRILKPEWIKGRCSRMHRYALLHPLLKKWMQIFIRNICLFITWPEGKMVQHRENKVIAIPRSVSCICWDFIGIILASSLCGFVW